MGFQIKSKKYYTFFDIQDLQKQNKNLLQILHSSCNINENNEIKLNNEILNKGLKVIYFYVIIIGSNLK